MVRSPLVLALDQGTTSSRAVVLDQNANIICSSQREFTQIYPKSGWVEPGRNAVFLRRSVDLPRSQRSWPVEESRLQLTHSSERATGAQANRIPTAISEAADRELDI